MDAAGFLIVAIEVFYIHLIIGFTKIRMRGVSELWGGVGVCCCERKQRKNACTKSEQNT